MLPVAVDAMGGDRAPAEIVAGARQAAARASRSCSSATPTASATSATSPVDAGAEVIDMHEDPAQGVRRKKDSSLVRAAEAVRDGRASAMVSAGNTGADHGQRPVSHGPAARRGPARHRHADPGAG